MPRAATAEPPIGQAPLELPIRSDVVGTLPSGILDSKVSPQRIAAPRSQLHLRVGGEPAPWAGEPVGLGWPTRGYAWTGRGSISYNNPPKNIFDQKTPGVRV